ncbi:hypothetical protein ABPG73_020461 [Tetrahymena malaccensis]
MKFQLLEDFLKANLNHLQEAQLSFSNKFINDQQSALLGAKLKNCKHLENLFINLSGNNIGTYGITHIANGIGSCLKLQKLDFTITGFSFIQINSQNHIDSKGAIFLGKNLGLCVNLVSLSINLENNQIGDIGAFNLVKDLNRCKYLQSIELGNAIKKQGGYDIGASLRKMTNLQMLHLELRQNIFLIILTYLVNMKLQSNTVQRCFWSRRRNITLLKFDRFKIVFRVILIQIY